MQRKLGNLARTSVLALAAVMSAGSISAETLRYATIGEPPSLDLQMGTATLATTIGQHMFEMLYAFDSTFEPQPFLATGETISDDGLTITIGLREGVKFHNGDVMDADDVVASLQRWGEFGARGKLLMKDVTGIGATGPLEVTITLAQPNGAWKSMLAFPNGGPVIYPAEIVSAAAGEPIAAENYVGTGPYKFSEWRNNRHVELVKFDDYSGLATPTDGYAGARPAEIDTIRFIPVPDVGTRVSGIQAGDYDYAEFISGDLYGILKDDPALKIHLSGAPIFGLVFMNSKIGPLAENYPLRRAILTALDMEEALRVSVGEEALWSANGSFFPEGNIWYTDAGTESYSVGDPEKAKEMAAAAGYDGSPIKLLVSTNYKTHFDQATVFTRQLADAGINIEMVVVDWATLLKKRAQPDQWDMFVTHHGNIPDPVLLTALNTNYPGWWATEEKLALDQKFTGTSDLDVRREAWAGLQSLIYEQVPTIKVGDVFSYDIASPKLGNMWDTSLIWPHFWGVTK
ncbi:ABC transporter substrate-binding protein [Aliiruegeria lutimaris]|uniref:Peptide/nickel transport system substrate-binding protein n=1 Tax=Aliiruegeria lutimaris TaxID=571298 RepID=A0A1G9D911_9RHOB|nr:ABC transporter substrate-binding protein [Aliiruegeria lutimaris]SDK60347.1 peptide/nickel transport system substrate-binding protein [Aliiruegeria lutimaris]